MFSFEFVYKALKQLNSKCTCVCVRCRHNCGMRVVIIIICLMYCYWQPVILYTNLIAINLLVNKILFSIIFAKHNGCMCIHYHFLPLSFSLIKVIIPTTELQRRTRTHLRSPVCPFLTLSSSFQPLGHFTKQLSHSRVKEKEEEGEQEGVRERQRRVLSLWSA